MTTTTPVTPTTQPTQPAAEQPATLAAQFLELRRLLAEAYEHYFEHSDGYCKSSEGVVSLHYPEFYWREENQAAALAPKVEIYSYVFGPSRSHWFNSMAEALQEVRKWHADEMATKYCPRCKSSISEGDEPPLCWCES